MASGPYWNKDRGTWSVQWFDGVKWRRTVVVPAPQGWRKGSPRPRKKPPEALAAVAVYEAKEKGAAARKRGIGHLEPGAWLKAWATATPEGEPATRHQRDMAIEVFGEWCKRHGVLRVDQVDSGICAQWLNARAATVARRSGKPIEHATLRKEKGLLMKAWSVAVEEGKLTINPWRGLKIPGKPTRKSRGSWEPEQFERLKGVARAWLRDILIVGVNTGLRIEALKGLEWRDVGWAASGRPEHGEIVVRPELDKNHKGYTVPMSKECHEVLSRRRIHRERHAVFVLTGGRNNAISEKSSATAKAIKRACKKAGLSDPDSPNHHMRRTFGRWAVLGHLTGKPIPIYVVSEWMGHSSVDMTQKYLQLSKTESQRHMLGTD